MHGCPPQALCRLCNPPLDQQDALTLCLGLHGSTMLVLQGGQAGLGLPQAPTQSRCLITGGTCLLLRRRHLPLQSSDLGAVGTRQLLKGRVLLEVCLGSLQVHSSCT